MKIVKKQYGSIAVVVADVALEVTENFCEH